MHPLTSIPGSRRHFEPHGHGLSETPISFTAKIAAGTVAGALSLFGGLTAASALSPTVADATHHVTPLSAKTAQGRPPALSFSIS